MKKILIKTLNFVLIGSLLFILFFTPDYRVKAKTIGDLKSELTKKQQEYEQSKTDKALTESEKKQVEANIASNKIKITNLKNEMTTLSNQIATLNKSIEEKYNEINNILNYVEISDGESSYLEYIFGAANFTDFIYRASIAEQLSKYNKELVDQYDKDIKESQDKQTQISNKQIQMEELQKELNAQSIKLGQEIEDLNDDMMSEEQEIATYKRNILELQNTYKCSDDEDIEACKRKAIAQNYIPASSGNFLRPINNAQVTGNFGWYDPYRNGNVTWHAAMDLAGPSGSKVYAAAVGKVVSVFHQSCGNNIVYIVHNINGNRYTTGYWHMRTAYVSVGQFVTSDTVIGIQGGLRSEDTCSSGEHLDFVVTTGAYKTDYFGNPRSVSSNPRNYIYFPALVEEATGVGHSAHWYVR